VVPPSVVIEDPANVPEDAVRVNVRMIDCDPLT
jgi:hypothetical protein